MAKGESCYFVIKTANDSHSAAHGSVSSGNVGDSAIKCSSRKLSLGCSAMLLSLAFMMHVQVI